MIVNARSRMAVVVDGDLYMGMITIDETRRGARVVIADEHHSLIWWGWVGDHLDEIWQRTVEHVQLTLIALFFGCLISFVLAFVAIRCPLDLPARSRVPHRLLYTIPSLALFTLLFPITGPRLS